MVNIIKEEIERTIERTKFGLAGAINVGHIPHQVPLGYKHKNKNKMVEYFR